MEPLLSEQSTPENTATAPEQPAEPTPAPVPPPAVEAPVEPVSVNEIIAQVEPEPQPDVTPEPQPEPQPDVQGESKTADPGLVEKTVDSFVGLALVFHKEDKMLLDIKEGVTGDEERKTKNGERHAEVAQFERIKNLFDSLEQEIVSLGYKNAFKSCEMSHEKPKIYKRALIDDAIKTLIGELLG